MDLKMTPEQIKENAPEGATHYILDTGDNAHFLMKLNDEWFSWGKKSPNSVKETQWNSQLNITIDYFMESIKPL